MTYNDYRTHMKVCEYLGKEPTKQFKKVYDHLTGLWDGMEIVVDSSTNRIVLQKEGEYLFEQNQENGFLWCQYEQVWSFFRFDMGMEITDTQDFIKSTVEEHLKCKVGTPMSKFRTSRFMVEEHLKCKVGTPGLLHKQIKKEVEEHLKCKVGTPPRHAGSAGYVVEEHLKCKVGTPRVLW